jgi:cell division protein FtsB
VRYLALERENQQLREQVAAAEAANALLRSQLLASAPAVQAGKGVQNMLDEMARAQAQWLDAWRAHSGGGEDK